MENVVQTSKVELPNLGRLEEEFSNFLFKVNEVSGIVNKLASKDAELQKIGDIEARNYLGENKETLLENLEDENIVLKIKTNKTVLNKAALKEPESKTSNEMSQEAFMREIEKDAHQRHKDRLIRTEKMETFKKQATLAFRRGDYERALVLYNKAIEQIKDCVFLYNNRALTYINLGFYDKAKNDLVEWALRLNEDCLKSWLLLAKAYYLMKDFKEYERAIREAIARNPENESFIREFALELKIQNKDIIYETSL